MGKALPFEGYAAALVKDPEATLVGAGIEPTPEMLEALKGVDVDSLKQLAAAFGEDRAAY